MSEDLGKARFTAHSIEQFYDFPSKQDQWGIITGLKGEIVVLLNDQHTLVENYIDLHATHTQMKSSLIPIIAKIPSYLLGTAIVSYLNTIHSGASRLDKKIRGDSSHCR